MSASGNYNSQGRNDNAANNVEYTRGEPAERSVPRSKPLRENFEALSKHDELRIIANGTSELVITPGYYFEDQSSVAYFEGDTAYTPPEATGLDDGERRWDIIAIRTDTSEPQNRSAQIVKEGQGVIGPDLPDLPDVEKHTVPLAFLLRDGGQQFDNSDIIDARIIPRGPLVKEKHLSDDVQTKIN